MKTFNEWLISEIKYEKPELNNVTDFRTILQNLSKEDCVRVALYCAEDVIHLTKSKEAKTCLNLVKKWLEDETSVTKEELRTAANADYDDDAATRAAARATGRTTAADAAHYTTNAAHYASVNAAHAANAVNAAHATHYSANAANYAANAAYYTNYFDYYIVHHAATDAANAAEQIRTQKTNQYLAYARQFAQNYHDPNYQDSAVKGKLPYLDYEDKNTTSNIETMLNYLQDEYTDRNVYNKDSFIYNPENFTLRLPTGYEISGKNRDELIQNIAKSRFAINYLNRMYNR